MTFTRSYFYKKLLFPALVSTLVLLIIGVLAGNLVRIDVLVVKSSNDDNFVFKTPCVIIIEYTHSVEKGRVMETLEANNDCIRLVSLKWQGHGAGMPSSLNDINGGFLEVSEGLYEVKMSKCLGKLITVNLDYTVDGRLTVNGVHFTNGILTLKLSERTFFGAFLDEVHKILSGMIFKLKNFPN